MDSEGKQSRLLGVANISLEGVDVLARSRKVDFLRNVKAITSSAVPNAADQDSKSVRVGCCNVTVHLTSEDEPATTPVEDGTFPSAVSDGVSGMDWHGLPVAGHHAAEPNGCENKENESSGVQAIASAGMFKS